MPSPAEARLMGWEGPSLEGRFHRFELSRRKRLPALLQIGRHKQSPNAVPALPRPEVVFFRRIQGRVETALLEV